MALFTEFQHTDFVLQRVVGPLSMAAPISTIKAANKLQIENRVENPNYGLHLVAL